jgi:hypothetical protein
MKYLITYSILTYVTVGIFSWGWATPATNVSMGYDGKIIHIEGDHPSDNLDKHFIQRVLVIKNSEEKQNFYFPRQASSSKFIADLMYAGNPGDHLDVMLYCSQGGIVKGSIDIPQIEYRKDTDDQKTLPSGK